MSPARVLQQRDRLLAALERLTRMGRQGEQPGALYVEIHLDEIVRAERIAARARAAIAKAPGSGS